MPTVKSQTPETTEEEKIALLFSTLKIVLAMIDPTIKAGNVKSVKALRKIIVRIGKVYATLRKSFDETLSASQAGFQGSDYLAGVMPIRKPRNSKPRPAAVDIFDSSDIFENDEDIEDIEDDEDDES